MLGLLIWLPLLDEELSEAASSMLVLVSTWSGPAGWLVVVASMWAALLSVEADS